MYQIKAGFIGQFVENFRRKQQYTGYSWLQLGKKWHKMIVVGMQKKCPPLFECGIGG